MEITVATVNGILSVLFTRNSFRHFNRLLMLCLHLSEIQVKIVPVTAVQLDAGKVEFVTNVQVTKARSQPVIRVVMSNGPLVAELHGM